MLTSIRINHATIRLLRKRTKISIHSKKPNNPYPAILHELKRAARKARREISIAIRSTHKGKRS